MSNSYSLVCHETKVKMWIGQGWKECDVLYVGDKKTIDIFLNFLNDNRGKPLYFIDNNDDESVLEYKDYDDDVKELTKTEKIVELIKEGLPKPGEIVGTEKTTIEVICQQVRRHLPETQELIGVIQKDEGWEILLKEK